MHKNKGCETKGDPKSSRQRGLDELDFLGEAAIKSHLPQKSPQFAKRGEKVSMNAMQEQKRVKDVSALAPLETIPHCNAEANPMGECIFGQSLISSQVYYTDLVSGGLVSLYKGKGVSEAWGVYIRLRPLAYL